MFWLSLAALGVLAYIGGIVVTNRVRLFLYRRSKAGERSL